MLFSLALILLCGILLGSIFDKLKLPRLMGMLLTGIILGPCFLNLLDNKILDICTELRQIALVIILTRAGLSLDFRELRKIGLPAILMCFVPASLEIIGMTILAPMFFDISYLEAAIMGAVVAAVSPAIIVPRMIKFMEQRIGTNKSIPQVVMAGSSVDDVFVIILFASFTTLAQGGEIGVKNFLALPISILLGLFSGGLIGLVLVYLFNKIHMRDSVKVIIIIAISFLLLTLEHVINDTIGYSGLLAIIAIGGVLKQQKCELAQRLSNKYSKLWIFAEILLFVLIGAAVNIDYALKSGVLAIVLILCVLCFRVVGVFLSLIRSKLNFKERVFVAIAYLPKATVQAAIGGIPLALGLACGEIVLTVAVLAILITAPLGAFLIDNFADKMLQHGDD